MLTSLFVIFIVLLFIGDIAVLTKGINEWKKKIETKTTGRNIWLIIFYIITTALVILLVSVYWDGLFK